MRVPGIVKVGRSWEACGRRRDRQLWEAGQAVGCEKRVAGGARRAGQQAAGGGLGSGSGDI